VRAGQAHRQLHLLKEGEAFREQARLCRRYGAAVIVMAFDEVGQADTEARKIEICTRAYRVLTEQVGFPAEDIIFDPNIFAVATGIEEHNNYAVDFIEATRAHQARPCPTPRSPAACPTSPSRSAATTRCARRSMRCSCTTPSRPAWTWASSTPASSPSTTTCPELREAVEDVILNRRDDATERLLDLAPKYKGDGAVAENPRTWSGAAGRWTSASSTP
jgi:5-methyltetrahydrofolate--homocysteine methyltransferase